MAAAAAAAAMAAWTTVLAAAAKIIEAAQCRGPPTLGRPRTRGQSTPLLLHKEVAASTGAEDTVDPVETAQRANKQAACVLPHDATPSLSLKASASRPVSPLNMASSCLSFYVPLLQPLFPSCFS
mmetsp:Transcript_3272/g.8747  ORF Transcript_3272/g.8747 Transcript_3272/m.8747 type:complete len:125 (-) Transcript_3272:485-859(-)